MGRKPATLILAVATALLLAGCLDDKPDQVVTNVYPTDYKIEIVNSLKSGVFEKNDTIRVTNALLSDPVLQAVGKQQLYVSCVRYTAHGVYNDAGNAVRVAYYFNGHLNQLIPADKDQCVNAAYKPFPELNELCIGKGCK
jgi:hypothetical protein